MSWASSPMTVSPCASPMTTSSCTPHQVVPTASPRAHLEEWLQTEWTQYKVFVTPVTEQWAQFAIAGPKCPRGAGETLSQTSTCFQRSLRRYGRPSIGQASGGYPVRAYSASVSRANNPTKWQHLPIIGRRACGRRILSAGAEFGIEPYGTEALARAARRKGLHRRRR